MTMSPFVKRTIGFADAVSLVSEHPKKNGFKTKSKAGFVSKDGIGCYDFYYWEMSLIFADK